jgi:aminopeptidase N
VADLTQNEAIERARAIEVDSYDVFLDLAAEPALSRTEVRFRWLRPGVSTFAELRTQGVRGVTLNGVRLPPPQDGRLRLSRADGGDQAVLVVEAEAAYSQEGRGLSRFTDPADGASYVMAFCYPDCGPELFCCFDQPDLTATFRFAVRVPGGWECVANGRLARREGDVCTFTPVSGMRPYDLTFCAGPFSTAARTEAGRTEVTVRHRQSLLGQAAVASLPRFAGYARDAIAWYADSLGVPCPYPAYDIVFMPDLAATALSVPGLMVVNEKLLGRPDGAGDQRGAMICAHEVAHLWFGAWWGRDGGTTCGSTRRSPPTCRTPRWPRSPGSANRCRGPGSLTPISRWRMRRTSCRAGSRCHLRSARPRRAGTSRSASCT